MRNQLAIAFAAALLTILAGSAQTSLAWEPGNVMTLTAAGNLAGFTALGPGRLAALSARQQLRDEICIALADGRISGSERHVILSSAKKFLKPKEYAGFKQSLDQLSPPTSTSSKTYTKITKNKTPVIQPEPLPTPETETSSIRQETSVSDESSPTPSIPTSVTYPDRVALTGWIR